MGKRVRHLNDFVALCFRFLCTGEGSFDCPVCFLRAGLTIQAEEKVGPVGGVDSVRSMRFCRIALRIFICSYGEGATFARVDRCVFCLFLANNMNGVFFRRDIEIASFRPAEVAVFRVLVYHEGCGALQVEGPILCGWFYR